jgi:crotonobetainyl-CoA:carnitine CoA-transferase CaiB-like acyl-CoA transferase
MSAALDDITVLDLTNSFSSSLSAAFLADFGGNVIRLELSPGESSADSDGAWNHEADLIHRNKQSAVIDPEKERGRELLAELAAKVDVVLTDWLIPDLQALGLDYATVFATNPGIIYGRASGFGPKGPDADQPFIDELAAARTGAMPTLPQPGEPPVYTGAGAMHASVMLAFGVVTALVHRQATGEGQEVDTSYFAANMYGASLDLQAFLAIDEGQRERLMHPISRLDVSNPISGSLYPSSDGRWVTLTMPDTDRWWPLLAPAVGIDVDDERFDSHEKRCEINRHELIHELEAGFQKHPGAHWRALFTEKQMSADVIEQFDYPARDPQVAANKYIMELDHPSFGKVNSLGFPIFMSDSPARLKSLAPCTGQHTASVLHEVLGYSEDEIYQLTTEGVVV